LRLLELELSLYVLKVDEVEQLEALREVLPFNPMSA
jgi:hypothetical protein